MKFIMLQSFVCINILMISISGSVVSAADEWELVQSRYSWSLRFDDVHGRNFVEMLKEKKFLTSFSLLYWSTRCAQNNTE